MRIEVTTLLELDVEAERERLRRCFKAGERKKLLAILELFAVGRFNEAMDALRALTPAQREYVHPVIDKVAVDAWRRLQRVESLENFDFANLPAHVRLAGGTNGETVSVAGLEYPKVRILPM